nr:ABC transporter A family member 9-like [Tanacetum cinerariifolium]
MVKHNNSSRYNDNKGKHKHHDNTKANPNKKYKVTCWKCGRSGHLKKDCKGGKVGNKANGSGTNGSVDGYTNSLKACSRVFAGDIYGDHVVSCADIIDIKHRHNVVCDTLVDICFHSGISAGKEVDIRLDGGRDKPLRPADILLYSWDGGLDVCVKLIGSLPLTQAGMADFVPGRAVIDAAQRKRVKYMAKCTAIGYGFLSFSLFYLGELEEDAVTLLKRIQKFSRAKDIGARVAIHIFNRMSFAIAKEEGNSPNDSPSISANSLHNPPHINERCFECGDALDGIFCQRCACKSCGKGAHIGYNCPPKVQIISNPEPCNQTMNNEPPQTLPSFDSTCYSDKEISIPCVSKPNFVDESSNIFNPPPQPPIYSCEFCGSNAQYGQYCTPQAPFINLEPGYSQDFNFSRDIHDFQQQYLCCDQCGARTRLFNVNLLIAKIEALKDNPTPSSEFLTKSSSTSPKPFLEGTDTYDNSLPEFENFCFDLEEISSGSTTTQSDISLLEYDSFIFDLSNDQFPPTDRSNFTHEEFGDEPTHIISPSDSGSTTTHSDISLPEYEALSFYDDHIEEIRSGSTTTQSDISLPEYDSFIFDLLNDQFPPTDRSAFTHEEFGDEPGHIISPPEYDCFYFRDLPNSGELISSLNSGIRENLSSTTCVNLPVEDDYSPLLAYAVWIFLAYLMYPVIPPHLYSFRNEDTIFDPCITISRFYSFKPGLSHRCGTFRKFNTHRSHLNESPMEMLFSTLFPMDQ